ncbi:MAG TPA: metallophosphoesterase [Coriobacteriia bacterium]|nr:metallophosphoesterase [Coriobacteriia bacterium]
MKRSRAITVIAAALLFVAVTVATAVIAQAATRPMVFAVIGDYGMDDAHEAAVAKLVKSWKPSFVIATGDGYYKPAGGTGGARYDESTGKYYRRYLKDITTSGTAAPTGTAAINSFFPAMGNHDYSDATPSPSCYTSYFKLPGTGYKNSSGNERYYEFARGRVHFFVLNSNPEEPDGVSSTSKQAKWLKRRLAASRSTFNIVYDHHPPYCSDSVHHSSKWMRWPYKSWGADAMLSGHAHVYERVVRKGFPYFVNGIGGAKRYSFGTPVSGSKVRYRKNWGAQRVTVTATTMTFECYSISGKKVDNYTVRVK